MPIPAGRAVSTRPGKVRPASPARSAGLVLMFAGGCAAALQMVLSWTTLVPGVELPGAVSGWSLFRAGQSAAGSPFLDRLAIETIPVVAGLGVVAVLAVVAVLTLPAAARPAVAFGTAAAAISCAGAVLWLFRAHVVLGRTLGDVFSYAGPGWWAFLLGGPVALAGAVLMRAGRSPAVRTRSRG